MRGHLCALAVLSETGQDLFEVAENDFLDIVHITIDNIPNPDAPEL